MGRKRRRHPVLRYHAIAPAWGQAELLNVALRTGEECCRCSLPGNGKEISATRDIDGKSQYARDVAAASWSVTGLYAGIDACLLTPSTGVGRWKVSRRTSAYWESFRRLSSGRWAMPLIRPVHRLMYPGIP